MRRTIRRRALIAAADRVAVAISGGADSVALLFLLTQLASDWQVAGIIHVNHGLRGVESDEDEAFVRRLADRLSLPIVVHHAGVAAHARRRRVSIEAAARELRYEAFEVAAADLGATLVATGHTEDDQAETVLLRLLRGSGARGLSGIRPRRGRYVRPLLDCRRADLRVYLSARGEAFREDASNADLSIPRNHLRHVILPAVQAAWPGAAGALARAAELASDDEAFLARTADEVAAAVTLTAPDGVQQIDTRGLNQLPPALARRVVRGAIERAGGTARFRDIERARAWARRDRADNTEGRLDLHGCHVECEGFTLTFLPGQAPRTAGEDQSESYGVEPRAGRPLSFQYELPVPGSVAVPETGIVIRASLITGAGCRPATCDGISSAVVQAGSVIAPFVVRSRLPGDRFTPFGAPGSRKLQDVLVDRKVPRGQRDRVPIVVDAAGRIVWVVGIAMADRMRVLQPERGMVVLESIKGNQ